MNFSFKNFSLKTPLALIAALPLLSGCEPEAQAAADLATRDGQPSSPTVADPMCTLEARPSAIVSLTDERGDEIAGPHATVTYSLGSSTANHVAPCTDATCEHWRVGYEKSGPISINAAACGGEGATQIDVGMTSDGCHVDTEYVELTVDDANCPTVTTPPPACNPVASPSVVVVPVKKVDDFLLPTDLDSLEISKDERSYPLTCLDEGCTQWVGPWSTTGVFTIEASACGETIRERVEVTRGECSVDTQYVILPFEGRCTPQGVTR